MPLLRRKGLFESNKVVFLPIAAISPNPGQPRRHFSRAGLEELGAAVAALFPAGAPGETGAMLTNARQAEAARRALDALREGGQALEAGLTPDAVLTGVEDALEALAELTGRAVREDVVDRIFSRFCVGK